MQILKAAEAFMRQGPSHTPKVPCHLLAQDGQAQQKDHSMQTVAKHHPIHWRHFDNMQNMLQTYLPAKPDKVWQPPFLPA
jgi:hypothetical protein